MFQRLNPARDGFGMPFRKGQPLPFGWILGGNLRIPDTVQENEPVSKHGTGTYTQR